MNRESIHWELKKLMIFPIPEIVIVSMIFNGTIRFPSLLLLSISPPTILSSIQNFVCYILDSMLSAFMVQGVITGVLAAILFVYERESDVLDVELVYSRSRKELFIGRFLALFLASIICVSVTTLILLVENLRGMWLMDSFLFMLIRFPPILVQTLFLISVSIFISVISQRSIISILSAALIFYSLDTMSFQYSSEEISFLSLIPPQSTRKLLIVPHMGIDALVTTLAVSIGFLLATYIYFTRFYEVG